MTDNRPRRGALTGLLELPRLVFVEPVRQGRLDWRHWPRNLRILTFVSLGWYVLATLAVVFSSQIRDSQELLLIGDSQTIPAVAVPFLMVLVVWCLCLLQTAALAAHWTLKLAALSVSALTIGQFSLLGGGGELPPRLIGAAVVLGLLVYTIIRWRGRFRAIDFFVVSVLVTTGTQLPLILSGQLSMGLGYDFRPALVVGTISLLTVLAIPAIFVSGGAFAQIAVTAGESVASVVRDYAARWVLTVALVLAFGLRGLQVFLLASDGGVDAFELHASALAFGVAILLVLLVWVAGRARRPERAEPGEAADKWSQFMYPLAIGFTVTLFISIPLTLISAFSRALGFGGFAELVSAASLAVGSADAADVLRAIVGLIALGVGFRFARQGRMLAASLFAAFAAIPLINFANRFAPLLAPNTTGADGIALLATGAALVAVGWLAATRTGTTTRWFAVLTALAVCLLYTQREVLDDPTTAIVGFSGGAATLLGLIWRLLTDGDFTRAESKGLPTSSRVMLFWANSLFAVTALTFVGLTKQVSGGFGDLVPFSALGDNYLGTPLFVTVVVASLATAFAGGRAKVVPTSDALDDSTRPSWAPPPPGMAPYPVAGPGGLPPQGTTAGAPASLGPPTWGGPTPPPGAASAAVQDRPPPAVPGFPMGPEG